jgi:hypothetical protein
VESVGADSRHFVQWLPGGEFSRNLKELEVHLTPAQLAQIATKAGTDPEHLVKDAVLRLLKNESPFRATVPELRVWRLGAIGPFDRRNLYDDIR